MFSRVLLTPKSKKNADGADTDKAHKNWQNVYGDDDSSFASEYSYNQRRTTKDKKIKRKVGRPRKEKPFTVFERPEIRPSTIEDCLHTAIYRNLVRM